MALDKTMFTTLPLELNANSSLQPIQTLRDFSRLMLTSIADLTCNGSVGVDPRSEVQCLLNGVKTNALAAVKTQIMASETL